MKTLLLLRHAKAQPDAPHGDRARGLTRRGERNAAAIAQRIKARAGVPDAIVTSDARRARQTAALAAEGIGFTAPLTVEPAIYDAALDDLMEIVHALPDAADAVLLVGHNPGFTQLAFHLAEPGSPVSEMPTASVAHLTWDAARWSDLRPAAARFHGLYLPD